MWIAVRQRFREFSTDLEITKEQFADGFNKHINIGRSLERKYYGEQRGDYPPGFMVGSWGKATQVRPPNDVDAFFILPPKEKQRFDARAGNVQSALLQEVKDVLSETYPQTAIRGDGQVVQVAFNSITIEVVPVFSNTLGSFWMPDTNEGGRWKIADPLAEIAYIETADKAMNGNVRQLAKMIKHWKAEKNVPLKSFIIELLVANFLPARGNGMNDFFWYDFYVRDFFNYLVGKANTYITLPGTGEFYFLGEAWLSRATTARDIAVSACYWELHDHDYLAGQEWQKIFGTRCPVQAIR